jgi:hypothetical protein
MLDIASLRYHRLLPLVDKALLLYPLKVGKQTDSYKAPPSGLYYKIMAIVNDNHK